MRLTRREKMLGAADYRFVFAQAQVSSDAFFRVFSRSNDRGFSRIGMAVSAKSCKKATGRNRLKRIIRESFREHQARLSDDRACDIVVLPTVTAATMCNKALFESLRGHWHGIEGRRDHHGSPDQQATMNGSHHQ